MEGRHARHRDVVLNYVLQKVEEVIDLTHGDEGEQPEDEVEEEGGQDVAVHELEDHDAAASLLPDPAVSRERATPREIRSVKAVKKVRTPPMRSRSPGISMRAIR